MVIFTGDSLSVATGDKLVPLNCSATGSELHVVSFQNAFLQTAVIEVNRSAPVVLFINIGAPLRVLRINAPTVTRVNLMSAFNLRDSLTVLDVDVKKVAFLDSFPYAALPFAYDAASAATKALLDAAEQYANLPVASYHGALTLSTLAIARTPASAVCKACGSLQRIDGRADAAGPTCVCEFGFARAAAADPCAPLTRTLTAKTTAPVSNAAPVEVRLTATEPLGYGAGMRCVFGLASVPAYWRAANEVACVIDPSKAIAPAKYDVKFFFTAATTGGVSVGGQVDVVDGAALCGAAATCGVCDKSACVYCADGARQCVPGTALGGPVGVCSNWFSRSCPDFVLSLDGAPQRANILAGNTHTYSFTVPAGSKEDVRVDVLSFPREVQMNSEVSLLMRRGQAPTITGSNNGVPVGTWDFANLTDKVPRGDFQLQQCDLGEGTYYVTVISQRPYSYDIRLNLACGCASSSGGTTPRITALTPSIGALVAPADTVRSVDIAGADFSDALQRLSCRFSSGGALPVYSVAQVSGSSVQCEVPSFDEAPGEDSRAKAPNSGRVAVSNNRCAWSSELVYRQYLNVVLGDQRTRAAAAPRTGVPTRLPVGQADYYRLDTRELGVAAVSFFVRQLEAGALALYVMPQEARDAALACGGSVRCGVRGSGSLASEYRLADCALEPGVWYFVVQNNGTAPVGYLAGSECGCGDTTTVGTIKSVAPVAGNVVGYDVLTIRGSGFQNATAKRCVFGGEGESPAQFVSSAEVRCVSVPQLSAARPRNVLLTVEGDSYGTLANKPCAKSSEFSFPYFVQLNRGQSFSVTLDSAQPSYFVFDLSQSVAVVQRRRQEARTESFKVTLTPSNVIRRFHFDVASGALPAQPTTDTLKGEQTKLFCHVPVTSRFYIGIWSASDPFSMKVAISDPPECLNMTASPLPVQTTAPAPKSDATRLTAVVGVATAVFMNLMWAF